MNQDVTPGEMAKIRRLADFDLIMLVSEISDHGWEVARRTLRMMPKAPADPPRILGDPIGPTQMCPGCGEQVPEDRRICPLCDFVIWS